MSPDSLAVVEATNNERRWTNAAIAWLFVAVGWVVTILTISTLEVGVLALFLGSALVPIVLLAEMRLWPRLLANFVVTAVNTYVTMIPVMLFAVANLDSAVWGTRTSEEVTSDAKTAFLLRMRCTKLAIALVYFVANFSLCFWADFLGDFITIWELSSSAILLLLYVFSLLEWRSQKAYLASLGLLESHDDEWPLDNYQKAGGAVCCDGCF